MDQKEKIENLKYTISRYDHYYDSVNSKSNVYLTLMTFLLGGTVALFRYAIDQKQLSTLNLVFLIITILIQIKGIMISHPYCPNKLLLLFIEIMNRLINIKTINWQAG